MLWGDEQHLHGLLGAEVASLITRERDFTFRFGSAEELIAFFRRWYGPTVKAFAALEGGARDALERDLVALVRRHDRLAGGAIAVPAAYAEAIAIRS